MNIITLSQLLIITASHHHHFASSPLQINSNHHRFKYCPHYHHHHHTVTTLTTLRDLFPGTVASSCGFSGRTCTKHGAFFRVLVWLVKTRVACAAVAGILGLASKWSWNARAAELRRGVCTATYSTLVLLCFFISCKCAWFVHWSFCGKVSLWYHRVPVLLCFAGLCSIAQWNCHEVIVG